MQSGVRRRGGLWLSPRIQSQLREVGANGSVSGHLGQPLPMPSEQIGNTFLHISVVLFSCCPCCTLNAVYLILYTTQMPMFCNEVSWVHLVFAWRKSYTHLWLSVRIRTETPLAWTSQNFCITCSNFKEWYINCRCTWGLKHLVRSLAWTWWNFCVACAIYNAVIYIRIAKNPNRELDLQVIHHNCAACSSAFI